MKQLFLFLYFFACSFISFTQITYDLSGLNDLEISTPEDFYPQNRVRFVLETNDGFIYANNKISPNTPYEVIINKTDNNLISIDSITYDELQLPSERIIIWEGDFNSTTGVTTLFGYDGGYFNHPPTFYKILINENFEVIETTSFEYSEKINDVRKPVKDGAGGMYILFKIVFDDGDDQVRIAHISADFGLLQERGLNYSWSFTDGLTRSPEGHLHIALSTGVVSFDSELNEISTHEIEGLAQYEFTCGYQRKTVNLSGDHQYFAGLCQEYHLDSLSPWIILGKFQRERIFKYNSATQSFQSFFNNVPFGYNFDYQLAAPYQSFDALNPNCLYLGNTFFKILSVSDIESVLSINSVDSTGNLRWLKLFGIVGFYSLIEIIALQDDGVLLTIEGVVQDEATEIWNRNVYYMKFDKEGNVVGTTNIPNLTVYDSYIKTFPNPVTDHFRIENAMAWKKGTQINIVNAVGQIMTKYEIKEEWEKPIIDVSNWQVGIYYLQVFNANGLVTRKVVVQ